MSECLRDQKLSGDILPNGVLYVIISVRLVVISDNKAAKSEEYTLTAAKSTVMKSVKNGNN